MSNPSPRCGLAFVALFAILAAFAGNSAGGQMLPAERPLGRPQVVARFYGPMPTGVTVSQTGRIFVNFPRWGDKVDFTVAELKNGRAVPFPNAALNRRRGDRPDASLISVQSVVVDPLDRLWILDTGSVKFGPTTPGGPKLFGVDLKTNRVIKKIFFPRDVALPTSYLNDVRFDLRRDREGTAFITDSSGTGPNAIIVVDLASGRARRRLNDHPSTKAEPRFVPLVEGRPMYNRPTVGPATNVKIGADGIAISADGERLFYTPLASRRLYSVLLDALADERIQEDALAQTVTDHGDKGGGSDGLESDRQGRIYLTSYEHNAVLRRRVDGIYETLVHDPRILWPDTLSVANNGYLYFTANQLHRQPNFNRGADLRRKPYVLYRVRINGGPVLLRR